MAQNSTTYWRLLRKIATQTYKEATYPTKIRWCVEMAADALNERLQGA